MVSALRLRSRSGQGKKEGLPFDMKLSSKGTVSTKALRPLRFSIKRLRPSVFKWCRWFVAIVVGLVLLHLCHMWCLKRYSYVAQWVFELRDHDYTQPVGDGERPPLYGKMTKAVYRVDAKLLGPYFAKAIEYYDNWIGENGPDWEGVDIAEEELKVDYLAHQHYKDCFEAPDELPSIAYETFRGSFYRKLYSKEGGKKLRETPDKKWVWRAGGFYSVQGDNFRDKFQVKLGEILDPKLFPQTRNSGTFWYPPGGVREWHTNAVEPQTNFIRGIVGQKKIHWLMYFTRVHPGQRNGTAPAHDSSAMHILESPGATPHDLTEAGGYRLTDYKGKRPNVWRIPDVDGYVTFFRLSPHPPFRWHCIVSENVNRYSLGFQFTETQMEHILEALEIPF